MGIKHGLGYKTRFHIRVRSPQSAVRSPQSAVIFYTDRGHFHSHSDPLNTLFAGRDCIPYYAELD